MVRSLICASALALVCSASTFAQSLPAPKLGVFTGPNPVALEPRPPVANGEGLFWSGDVIRKATPPTSEITMGHFAWTPDYRLSVLQRPATPDPAKAQSEMHEDKTQIFFIVSGAGTEIMGGKPTAAIKPAPEGNHFSEGELVGAKAYRIKAGDMLVIPPMTWHQMIVDKGQTVTYEMVHVESRTRMP